MHQRTAAIAAAVLTVTTAEQEDGTSGQYQSFQGQQKQ